MNVETASATAAIRAAMYARRADLAMAARDIGASAESLFAFVHNGAGLSAPLLEALTQRIWGGAFKFVPESDSMVHAQARAPTPVPVYRAPVARGKVPTNDEILETMRNKGPAPKQSTKPAWLR